MLLTVRMNQVPEDTQDEELPMLMLAYHSSVQESTQFTLYRLMGDKSNCQCLEVGPLQERRTVIM